MKFRWKALAWAWFLGSALGGAGQAISPGELEAQTPALTLDWPRLRSSMDHLNTPGTFWEKLPDFRLKLDRSEEILRSPLSWDEHLRGVEIRLPMSAFWVGYNLPDAGEDPQATVSIQLGF